MIKLPHLPRPRHLLRYFTFPLLYWLWTIGWHVLPHPFLPFKSLAHYWLSLAVSVIIASVITWSGYTLYLRALELEAILKLYDEIKDQLIRSYIPTPVPPAPRPQSTPPSSQR